MITFKQFISEAAVDKTPKYKSLNVEQAIDMLNKNCKNALWMLSENHPIYRGDSDRSLYANTSRKGFATVNTSKTMRQSENTTNFYTEILDNHPDRQHFPKRSKSFIGSTKFSVAKIYGRPYVMIPFDNAKIGLVGKLDMWETVIKIFNTKTEIHYVNDVLKLLLTNKGKNLQNGQVIKALQDFDRRLKQNDADAISRLEYVMPLASDRLLKKYKTDFFNTVMAAYSEEATGHKSVTTATMPRSYLGEVWVEGNVVMIQSSVWDELLEAWRQNGNV